MFTKVIVQARVVRSLWDLDLEINALRNSFHHQAKTIVKNQAGLRYICQPCNVPVT